MSIKDDLTIISEYADEDICDGTCDVEPPYKKCKECYARHTLNNIGEELREAIKYIKQ